MKLGEAQRAFRALRKPRQAGYYLKAALGAEAADQIDDDTFLDILSEIATWLSKQPQ